MNIFIVRSAQDIETAFERLSAASILGCDTETSSLSVRNGRLFSVQFSDGDFNVLVPLSEGIALGKLADILENKDITKIFHNAAFDLNFLRESGYTVENFFCTMIAEKCLTRGADQSVSLAETLYRYFAVNLDKSQRAKFSKNWDGIWTEELIHYALSDVVYLPELMRQQTTWLEKLGLQDTFKEKLSKLQ